MVSKIVPDEMNEKSFIYYYSENGEATNDLNDSSNGWTDEIESLDNVKSFLIVPIDPEYRMENASKLRFTYEYEIPENLEHNNEIYGTFATYYTNNTDVATISEVSRADLVGLTTGQGPQFDFETSVNKEKLKEYEEFEITTIVKNTGKEKANDIVVTVPVPEYTSYVSDSCDKDEANSSVLNNQVQFKLNSLEVDDTVEFKVTVVAQGINKDLYTEHKTVRDKNGNIIEQNEDSEERSEVQIKVFSLFT